MRETREETGIRLSAVTPTARVYARLPEKDLIYYVFRARLDKRPAVTLEEGEFTEYLWATREQIKAMPYREKFPDLDEFLDIAYAKPASS